MAPCFVYRCSWQHAYQVNLAIVRWLDRRSAFLRLCPDRLPPCLPPVPQIEDKASGNVREVVQLNFPAAIFPYFL